MNEGNKVAQLRAMREAKYAAANGTRRAAEASPASEDAESGTDTTPKKKVPGRARKRPAS